MRLNLEHLHEYLSKVDNDPVSAVAFMNIQDKMSILFNVLRDGVVRWDYRTLNNREDIEKRVKEVYMFINENWHDKCWSLHDVHFHPSFGHYVNCTYTCASEIDECVSKILMERFRA